MSTLNQLLTEHRRSLLEQERHTASLEVRHNTGQPAETDIVNAQLERNMDAFTTDEDFVTERHPYSGWICYHKDHDWAPDAVNTFYRGHGATEAEAVQDYRELNDLCECGGTYDEYERCSDCQNGHDDCEVNECFPCLERANDRAERMAEGMER